MINIQVLLTGNELMSGHTVDSNSAMMAEYLGAAGYAINRKVTVGDEFEELVSEIRQLSLATDVLIVNGGLGPTIDDLTAEALAKATNQPIAQHADAITHLESWCQRRKIQLNDANLKQAMLPAGVEIVPNPTGSAVGFSTTFNDCLIICTPGVPSELRGMLEQTVVASITAAFPIQDKISTLRFQTFGLGESSLQQILSNDYNDWPHEVELGFRAGLPLLEVKLTVRQEQHMEAQRRCYQKVRELIGDYIVGEDSTNLAQAVITALKTQGKTLSTAESCTGGLIAASITEIAGASAVFEAGFVTYSNAMKSSMLGVEAPLLEEHGAVSEPVVGAMARGAMQHSSADFSIAVSGIAGPEGGTADKPVGTVWIAWGSPEHLHTRKLQFNAPRKWFQQMVTATCLDLLRRQLLDISAPPRYFKL